MLNVFKITKAGAKPIGRELLGLLIVHANDGFYVVDPEPELHAPHVLAKAGLFNMRGKPLVNFMKFEFNGGIWDLTINTVSPLELTGDWRNPGNGIEQDEDSWTAAGTGTGDPEGDQVKAASAN